MSLVVLLFLAADVIETDVVVYGGTPAGIAAALAATEAPGGSAATPRVLLIEPTAAVGGLMTSGLSHPDYHSFESLSGSYLEFAGRVHQHYIERYGTDSPQATGCMRGTSAEPHVNQRVLEAMLAERPTITVRTNCRLVRAQRVGDRITSIDVREPAGLIGGNPVEKPTQVVAAIFVDASYEGDLMAAAGVPFRVGREGQGEFGESLAPETADDQLQAYNFRFILTNDPANRRLLEPPEGYKRDDFVGVLEVLASGAIDSVFGDPRRCLFKAHEPPLPNGKYDINDVSGGRVRLSLPGKNLAWPRGTSDERAAIVAEHRRDQEGLLYFLQTDEAVPERFRTEAREWGWCRDEFPDFGGRCPQLYVREARRMEGRHLFSQRDVAHASWSDRETAAPSEATTRDARAVFHREAIAMGDYGNNCHGTGHEGPRWGGRHTGEFYHVVPPYQIPFGTLLPRDVTNLLVPVAASSTHVGFCALRLEPIWMSLGQAAGAAAAMAFERQTPVQDVDVATLQRRLHAAGSATIYVSDVLPGDPNFAAVQWWGGRGGLHRLAAAGPTERGRTQHGQYTAAAPNHAAELDRPLDEATRKQWLRLVEPSDELRQATTRGEFIRRAFGATTP